MSMALTDTPTLSMNAWKKNLDESKSSGIRFVADGDGSFTRAMDMEIDSKGMLGTNRSKRYAVLTEDGKITKVSGEPDKFPVTGALSPRPTARCRMVDTDDSSTVSGASQVLG